MRATLLPSQLPSDVDALRLLPLTDLHLSIKPETTALLLADSDYLQSMDYVVLLGDQAAAWGTEEEYAEIDKFIQRLPRPYGAINGNHEFFFEVVEDKSVPAGRVFNQASPQFKAEQLEKFREFFGYEKLWRVERNALGTFLYLCLDDVEHSRPEALSAPQQAFLEAQLRAFQDEPVYVFCHAPLSLGQRLDITYYDETRTACVELTGVLRELCAARQKPLFWVSGHIHLRPDHYLYSAYELAPNVWQVHCPDGLGYSRWNREQVKPEMHDELFSRHLEISRDRVTLVTRDHTTQEYSVRQTILFPK